MGNHFVQGDIVLVTYGYNSVTKEPFKFLYDFGYYSKSNGRAIVYIHGEENMQDSCSFPLKNISLATKEERDIYDFGI